jgi:Predicted membrane protein (DUF2079)
MGVRRRQEAGPVPPQDVSSPAMLLEAGPSRAGEAVPDALAAGRGDARGWAGPLALAGLILVFTLACGRWMVALHENGHAETRQDVAALSQAIWNTARGRLVRQTVLYEGGRDHLEPVLLVYALNYTAGGSMHSLLYLHALVIGLGAVPFYALGRYRGRSAIEAWLMAAGYLALPPLHRLIEKDYLRTDVLLFPALALLAYAATARRDRLALLAAALALCARESGALAVMGLGIYWLWGERRAVAGWALVVLGAAWLPLVNYVWLPWFMGHATQHADRIRSPAAIGEQLAAIWALRWPVGLLALTVLLLWRRWWAVLLAGPTLIALPFYRVALRYSAPLFSVAWMGIVDEIARWSRPGLRRAALVAFPGLFVVANVGLSWRPLPDEGIRDARRLLALVPPDAAVCADSRVLGHLSTRERLYEFNRRHYFPEEARACLDARYFLLNRSGRDTFFIGSRRHQDRAKAFDEVAALGVETVAESGAWVLARRGA